MRQKLVRSFLLVGLFLFLLSASQAQQVAIPAAGVINTIVGGTTPTLPSSNKNAQGLLAQIQSELYEPNGVAVDTAGNIYFADAGFNYIGKVAYSTGIITVVAGNGTAGFAGDGGAATSAEITPSNLVVDAAGDIYFIDTTCRVRTVWATGTAAGTISTVAGNGTCGYSGDGGPATSAEINSPIAIALDISGNLYIADRANFRIRKVTTPNALTPGTISTVAGNGIQICCGQSMSYGDGGAPTSAEFSTIQGVAVDPQGNLYVSDETANRIRKVTASTGIINTVVGNGTAGYSGDGGLATSAEISHPANVVSDAAGNIYLFDSGNARIRKVLASTQIITTIAGDGSSGFSGDGGAATSAEIWNAPGLAVDPIGNNYFSTFENGSSYTNSIRAVGGNTFSGWISPKYMIVGVTYAPPGGTSSYVQYQNSTLVGSSTSITQSFSNSLQQSMSVSSSASLSPNSTATGSVIAGSSGTAASGKITASSATTVTQGSSNSLMVTTSVQTTTGYKTLGVPDILDPVDHDDDMIWVWLNPLVLLKVNQDIPGAVQWNGFNFDSDDGPGMDVYGVHVGELKYGLESGSQDEFARLWAAAQTWPTGAGPALTSADYLQILQADPFSNDEYTLPETLPQVTPDGRFTLAGTGCIVIDNQQFCGTSNFVYESGVDDTFTLQNVNSTTVGQGTNTSFQQMFSVQEQFTLGPWSNIWKQSDTLTWSNTSQENLTTTQTLTNNLQINGPTTSPYVGPPAFYVYQDNNYGTFMFAPTQSTEIYGMSPTFGPVSTPVTITGTNFGPAQGACTVTFNGTLATPTSWSNTSITVPVPAGATTGYVDVVCAGLGQVGLVFTVAMPPSIIAISPPAGPVGQLVTITGNNFGSTQGLVSFNGDELATPTSWSNTVITLQVPTAATTGNVVVMVNDMSSNAVGFTVGTPSFTMTATNPSQTTPLSLGHSETYTINVSALGGFTGPVALSVSGLPQGVTAQFSTASINTSGSATLTLTAAYSNSTYIGTSNVVITGSSGILANSAAFALATQPMQYNGTCGAQ